MYVLSQSFCRVIFYEWQWEHQLHAHCWRFCADIWPTYYVQWTQLSLLWYFLPVFTFFCWGSKYSIHPQSTIWMCKLPPVMVKLEPLKKSQVCTGQTFPGGGDFLHKILVFLPYVWLQWTPSVDFCGSCCFSDRNCLHVYLFSNPLLRKTKVDVTKFLQKY